MDRIVKREEPEDRRRGLEDVHELQSESREQRMRDIANRVAILRVRYFVPVERESADP